MLSSLGFGVTRADTFSLLDTLGSQTSRADDAVVW